MLRWSSLQELPSSGIIIMNAIQLHYRVHSCRAVSSFLVVKVISAAKYIMKKESTRDHVDLLLSSKCWPLVYAVDMACDVVAHVQVRDSKLATAL